MRNSERPVDPMLIDLGKRDQDYILYYGDKPLRTAGGHDYCHPSDRLLRMIMLDIFDRQSIKNDEMSPALLFELQKDLIEHGRDPVHKHLDRLMELDPFISMKVSGTKIVQMAGLGENGEPSLPVDGSMISRFWSVTSLLDPLNEYINGMLGKFEVQDRGDDPVLYLVRNAYVERSKPEKAVMQVLCFSHQGGIILPLLWILGTINSSEYMRGVFALRTEGISEKIREISMRTGLPFGRDGSSDAVYPEPEMEKMRRELSIAADYLAALKPGTSPGRDLTSLIRAGESSTLEFKSTLRWDLRGGKTNPAIERAALKTVAAFLNTDGGILLIGVRDDGSIEGIESDNLANEDKFLLHFWTLVRTCFGREVSPYIRTDLKAEDGRTVCIVTCSRCDYPVFLNQPGFPEEFYIRVGPSSNALSVSEALKYIGDRFPVSG